MTEPTSHIAHLNAQMQPVDELDPEPVDPSLVWYNEYKDMSYAKLAAKMLELRTKSAELEKAKIMADKELQVITLRVVPERFLKDEITSMNVAGIGRLGISKDAHCTVPPANAEQLQQWLIENEFGDLIKPTVNSSSLKALVKNLEKDDNEAGENVEFDPSAVEVEVAESPFEQICKLVSYTPFMRAAVTKK